jgi:hypothetical protein
MTETPEEAARRIVYASQSQWVRWEEDERIVDYDVLAEMIADKIAEAIARCSVSPQGETPA